MDKDLRFLFSDKALKTLGFKTKDIKPANKEYAKLRKKLKSYPIISWYNGKQPIYRVDYDFFEEFYNCKDFESGGHSNSKFRDGLYLHRISVKPYGARRYTYYKMVTEFDERMIDKSVLDE